IGRVWLSFSILSTPPCPARIRKDQIFVDFHYDLTSGEVLNGLPVSVQFVADRADFSEGGIHSASTPDVPWLLTVPRRSRREAQTFRSAAVFGRRNFGRLWCSGLPAHRLPSRIAAPEDGRTPFGCGASRAAPYRRFAIGRPFGVTHRLTRSSPPQKTIPRYIRLQ